MKRSLGLGLILAGLVTAVPAAAEEVIDRIVAVVGHHIILSSELESQTAMYATQQRLDPMDSAGRAELQLQLLDQMINDRLMLIQAERDTTVRVNDREVERELDLHLNRIQGQFPSPEDFYKQLAREGLSVPELRRRYRREVRNQLLKQKLIDSRIRSVEISAPEVDAFFRDFQDSLPSQIAAVHLMDVLYPVEISSSTIDSVQRRALAVHDSIVAGADFAEMARNHSDDVTGSSGGDLGWFGRGVMVPEFERAAFGLVSGEVSGPVQTTFGFHLIKSLEREGDRVHAAHILFRTLPSETDMATALSAASDLRSRIEDGADFAALAKEHSADSVTASVGGDLGWIPLTSLPEPFKSAVGQEPAGTLLPALPADDGIHIVKIADRRAERPYDLALDRAELTEMARREKTGRLVDEWVEKLRDEIFVDVRL